MGRIISTESLDIEEQKSEYNLRPQYLSEYIGQKKVKDNLHIFIEAAKKRNEPLDHLLLYGPPGLGKTTLSTIVANEMGVNIKITSGPAIEKPGELAAILNNLSDNDILFIDEIHRLSKMMAPVFHTVADELNGEVDFFSVDVDENPGLAAANKVFSVPTLILYKNGVEASRSVGAISKYDLLDFIEKIK